MTRAEAPALTVRRRAGGFTMIEVVAAVVVLGIWFTVLVTIVSSGVAVEATNRLRLEASLVADEALADAEATLLTGGGVRQIQLGDEHPYGDYTDTPFDVLVTSESFNPLEGLAAREGAAITPEGLGIDVSLLPPDEQAAALAALLKIRVEVYRAEGEFDLREARGEPAEAYAMRTTYAIDPTVLESLTVPTISSGGFAPGSGDGDSDDPSSGSGAGGIRGRDRNVPLGETSGS